MFPTLCPGDNLIPYDLIVSFWSDGAEKSRWVSLPSGGKIKFAPTSEWGFPAGTVFVKNFELATDETNPGVKRRHKRGCWFAMTAAVFTAASPQYKWREGQQ